MLTHNYYKMMSLCVTGNYSGLQTLYNWKATPVTQYWNSDMPSSLAMANANFHTILGSTANVILLGNGTTEPNANNYTLSGDVFTDATCQSYSGTIEMMPDGYRATKILFIRNTGTEDFTVSEIGWFAKSGYLLDRTLLETPLTIPAGQVGQINYSIYFKYPSVQG